MPQQDSIGQLVPLYIKLPPENIVFIKNILESYDGLGVVRTLNQHTGNIVILALEDTERYVRELLEDLEPELKHRYVPPPQSYLNGDWLLNEEYGAGSK